MRQKLGTRSSFFIDDDPYLLSINTFIYYRYKRNGGKYWKNFINTKGEEWARMNLDWFHSFSPENRLVTFYDELLSKPLAVLKTILEFLQVILYLFIIKI